MGQSHPFEERPRRLWNRMLGQPSSLVERCGLLEESLKRRGRRGGTEDMGYLIAPVSIRMAGTRRHYDDLPGTGALPLAAAEEFSGSGQHLEALLHPGVDVWRHSTRPINPYLNSKRLPTFSSVIRSKLSR